MRKRLKVLLGAIVVSLNIMTLTWAVKADSYSAASLVEQAIKEKTFYHYNIAYYEAMKLTDESEKNRLLGKLSSISNIVWNEDIKKLYGILLDMVDTAGGRVYDSIQVSISNANIPEVDKQYLLGEVTSWGRKLVWTEDYGQAIDAIINAWTKMDINSINNAEAKISQMKNNYSKGYLEEELAKIKAIFYKTTAEAYNNNGNIANYGFIAHEGDWAYYANSANGRKLSKVKTDGTEVTRINDDEALFINVVEGWIYYCNYSDNGAIYKVSVDGTGRIKLSSDSAVNLNIENGWIYYENVEDGYRLYRMNLDGTNRIRLTEDIPAFVNIVGEYIYYSNYSNYGEIIRINGEGKKKVAINDEHSVYTNVVGEWIYYKNEEDKLLYKMKLDGTEKKKLLDKNVKALNVAGKWIYYISESDNNTLWRLSIDGTINENLTPFPVDSVNISKSNIFFFDEDSYLYSMKENKTELRWFGVDTRIAEVEDIYEEIGQGDYYETPEAVTATMSDGSKLLYKAVWDTNNVDSSKIGSYSYKGKIEGYAKEITVNVKVSERGNSNGNIVNGGALAGKNGWLYFADESDKQLYKIKEDGTTKIKLSSDQPKNIHVVGDWVYYINLSDGNKIYKIKIDGTGRAAVAQDWTENISVVGEWIFYSNLSDNTKLYKIKIDGSSRIKLNDDRVSYINTAGDWIYYLNMSGGNVNRVRIRKDGSQRNLLNEKAGAFIIDGRFMYQLKDDGLYRSDLKEKSSIKLNIFNVPAFNISEEKVYYSKLPFYASDDHEPAFLYVLNNDNTGDKLLAADEQRDLRGTRNPYFINVIGDWVYYKNYNDDGKTYRVHKDGTGRQRFGVDRTIDYVEDVNVTVLLNEQYSLPKEVMATNVGGEKIEASVTWDAKPVNTKQLGTTTYYGTIAGTDKKVKLNLYVVDKELVGNTGGNITEGAFVVQNGDTIFINNYMMKADGTGKVKYQTGSVSNLNSVGDWIYYSNGHIYKIKRDGTSKTLVTNDTGGWLNVVGDWIYYKSSSDLGKIYKVRTSGTDKQKVTDDVTGDMIVSNGWIYYTNFSDGRKLYKIRTNGTERTKLSDEELYDRIHLNVVGDWIYYQADYNTIYKMKSDGTSRQLVKKVNQVMYIIVEGEWIYFEDNYRLSRMKTDGTNVTTLLDFQPHNINVVGDWLYYFYGSDYYRIRTNGTDKQQIFDDYKFWE